MSKRLLKIIKRLFGRRSRRPETVRSVAVVPVKPYAAISEHVAKPIVRKYKRNPSGLDFKKVNPQSVNYERVNSPEIFVNVVNIAQNRFGLRVHFRRPLNVDNPSGISLRNEDWGALSSFLEKNGYVVKRRVIVNSPYKRIQCYEVYNGEHLLTENELQNLKIGAEITINDERKLSQKDRVAPNRKNTHNN